MEPLELPDMTPKQEASWRGMGGAPASVDRRRRHLEDLATLATLIRISDRVGEGLNHKENGKLFTAYSAALTDPVAKVSGRASDSLVRLRQAAWPKLALAD